MFNINKFYCSDEDISNVNHPDDAELNQPITKEGVIRAITNVDDFLINEYLCATADVMSDVYVNVFNIILDTGIMPEAWLNGNIIPIFKNKGSKTEPKNYRPITLLSNLGKSFTSIFNHGLSIY